MRRFLHELGATFLFCVVGMALIATVVELARGQVRAMPKPRDAATSQAAIDYGRALAFDTRLSRTGTHSCMTCHLPERGYSDGKRVSDGATGRTTRNAPTLINAGYKVQQFHDGRADLLEGQAREPLKSLVEMGQNDEADAVRRVAAIPGYQAMNVAAFGRGVQDVDVLRAISAFERTLVSTDAPIDRVVTWTHDGQRWTYAVDRMAAEIVFNDAERRGFGLFFAKGCVACHQGPDYRDGGFHNSGVAIRTSGDGGRDDVPGIRAVPRSFATPTLREIHQTGPYFHDGSAGSLAAVVAHYGRLPNDQNLDPRLRGMTLSVDEQAHLALFLSRAFAGVYPVVTAPSLPPDTAQSLAVAAQDQQQNNQGNGRRFSFRRRR